MVDAGGGGGGEVSIWPQARQNLVPSAFSAWQCEHVITRFSLIDVL